MVLEKTTKRGADWPAGETARAGMADMSDHRKKMTVTLLLF
jgi:hypothetical protein